MTTPRGVYLHVPFCLRKCPYCDFYSVQITPALTDAYTEAVCRNLRRYGDHGPLQTIYFGGGTPSLLSPRQVDTILETARQVFDVDDDAEITLEANPATVDREALAELRSCGVNRLSVGVQSLQDTELQALGRLHSAHQAFEILEAAHAVGFTNLSADVMLATPGQTLASLTETLKQLTQLPLTHISAYLLKIESETPFGKNHAESQCPDDDQAADFYLATVDQLADAGFLQYEVSNFAKPGYESRHNCLYWRCQPYLGLGPSAHSDWNGTRFYVPNDVHAFVSMDVQPELLEDANPHSTEERLMLRMRLVEGAPREAFAPEKAEDIDRYLDGGFLVTKGDNIAFTPKGFLVSNTILADLL